ncbi:MAG: ASCH domain-containing protein [Propionibacteriaceae bacterium]|jgi:uncharacterized protein YhfF|nr:ASCH domain-containing protein [Propionibacteriaceae bacterium]
MTDNRAATETQSMSELDRQVSATMIAQDDDGNDDSLQGFWAQASRKARLGDLEVFMGTPWGEAVPPPTWSFSDDPAVADELLDLVLTGKKVATSSLERDYIDHHEPLPEIGDLSILVDSAGQPHALIRDVEVKRCRFDEITPTQAAAESEGDLSLEQWRDAHRKLWSDSGTGVDGATMVVWERFKVLYRA